MKHELTQEEILVEIKDILSEYIEITRPLTPADRLIDDLGLDSFFDRILYHRDRRLLRDRYSGNGFYRVCHSQGSLRTDSAGNKKALHLLIPACHRQVIINSFCK